MKYVASVNVGNHVVSGSCAFENVWKTWNPHRLKFAGMIGICFIINFLPKKHFKDCKIGFCDFKMRAANAMVSF